MATNRLTELLVKSAKPGTYVDGGGLRLVVKASGAKSFVYRYMIDGRSREIGLGRADGATSLAKVRTEAGRYREAVREGRDPLEERLADKVREATAAANRKTFRECAGEFLEAKEGGWRNDKHRAQWRATLAAYAYPSLAELPVGEIETAQVVGAIKLIWSTIPETASRVRGRIEAVLNFANTHGYRTGDNPARWRGHLANILTKRDSLSRGHHAAMPFADVPSFVTQLRQRDAMAARALEFAILTAARTGEVIGAMWSEVDLSEAVWTIPAVRMKAKREHRVPLSPRAVALLETLAVERREGIVFRADGGGQLSNMAMSMLMRRMLPGVRLTVHGFRSSFRDWAGECTSFPFEVCEAALAHSIGNKVVAAYRRGDALDKRRELMKAWDGYCAGGVGKVIRLAVAA